MKHLYRLVVIGLASVGVSAAPLFTHAAAPAIFISEVSWAGSSLSASDEFIELFNASAESVPLKDWSLHGAATGGEALSLPEDAVIPPYSTYLIANYDIDEDNSVLVSPPNFVTSRLALPNTKLSVALVDARGTVRDRAGDGAGTPPAGSSGMSMMRVDASLDGASDEAWADSVSTQGFKLNLSDLGTPGFHDAGETAAGTEAGTEAVEEVLEPEPITITEPEPASEMEIEAGVETDSEPEAIPEPEPLQVHPNEDDVITVIYRGYVFELNLPEQNVVEAPNIPATDNVVQTVSPPSPELEALMASAASSTDPETDADIEEADDTEPAIPVMSLQTLRFSEVYPNTVGSDEEEEYIEIENFGDAPIDLLNWSIKDAAEKTWTAEGSFTLEPGSAVALPRVLTKITLNNNEETLTLTHPNGQVIDVISYGKAPKGATYARAGEGWVWSEPTPGVVAPASASSSETDEAATNALVVPTITIQKSSSSVALLSETETKQQTKSDPESIILTPPSSTDSTHSTSSQQADARANSTAKTGSKSTSSAAQTGSVSMTIAEARNAALGTAVRLEGVVTALPGTFAAQSFYIEDGAGIQVYMYAADFPELSVGDRVRVSGVVSQNRGEARVKLSGRDALEVLGSGTASAQDMTLEAIGETVEARLVTVEALVESARSDEMTLVSGEMSLRVAARERTGISFSAISSGSRVRITGIVSDSSGTYTLLPRSQSDIRVVELASSESATTAGTLKPSGPPAGVYGGLLAFGTLSLAGFWFLRARRQDDLTLTNV